MQTTRPAPQQPPQPAQPRLTLGQQAARGLPDPAQEKWREIWNLEPATLLVLLKDPKASLFLKAKICQRLAAVGTREAVPVLAGLLADPLLSHYARFALEPLPDPAADRALEDAAQKLEGPLLAGVLNSLGVRRNAAAIPLVARHLEAPEPETARAAAAALGRIGGPQAAESLLAVLRRRRAEIRSVLHDACLVCGESLSAGQETGLALSLYEAVRRDRPASGVAEIAGARISELEQREGFQPIFNGRDLEGWDGDPRLWRVQDGAIVGSTEGLVLERNSFLIHRRPLADFHLKLETLLRGGNSGIQFRSEALPGWVVRGLQADMAAGNHWGSIYDEGGRRGIVVPGWRGKAETVVLPEEWNDYEILCRGELIQLKVNGLLTAELRDRTRLEGVIALQLHRGPAMEVRFRNLRVKRLP